MKILAFETSCDDTSIAIFENEKLLFMETKSQIKVHKKTSGVVPELAAREHANVIFKALKKVLNKTNLSLKNIDYIAVTTNPGLIPSLLTGICVAYSISSVLNIPLLEINHIQAHIFSNFLEREEIQIKFPLICLTVSGGHNDLYLMKSMWDMKKIGQSLDDASGEAFDKVAKMMNMGYPGGPLVAKLAEKYRCKNNIGRNIFPRVWLDKKGFCFSFSGLKSAVKREISSRINKKGFLSLKDKQEISFEFENSLCEVLSYKLVNSAKIFGIKNILLSGGVSANEKLKEEIRYLSKKNNLYFLYPKKNIYSMDNAAMVGILAFYKIKYGY